MQLGVVRSYRESFFSFKGNKVIIKLPAPVFQIVMQEKGLTCTSKKIELHLASDLSEIEAVVMGKNLKLRELETQFLNLKSNLWISTVVDSSDLKDKLMGIAKTCDGKSLFAMSYDSLAQGFSDICHYADQDMNTCKSVIKEYCEKNVDILNDQIRRLTAEKNLYQELGSNL